MGSGSWRKVKEFILTGYKKLFSTELNYSTLSSEVSHFSSCFLTEEEKNKLNQQISEEEIRAGMWAFKAFKAPGPDDLHASFFQYFWHNVKESVCMPRGLTIFMQAFFSISGIMSKNQCVWRLRGFLLRCLCLTT